MADLAALYEAGHGVPVDLKRARELYERAASNGNEDAKKWLASHSKP